MKCSHCQCNCTVKSNHWLRNQIPIELFTLSMFYAKKGCEQSSGSSIVKDILFIVQLVLSLINSYILQGQISYWLFNSVTVISISVLLHLWLFYFELPGYLNVLMIEARHKHPQIPLIWKSTSIRRKLALRYLQLRESHLSFQHML